MAVVKPALGKRISTAGATVGSESSSSPPQDTVRSRLRTMTTDDFFIDFI
jgi:hypothetical protein